MNGSRQQQLFEVDPEPTPWEQAAESDRLVADIVFDRPLQTVFQYLVPDGLADLISVGARIRAPFGRGNQTETGFCVGLGHHLPPGRRLKEIDLVLDDAPLLTADMLELTRWMAERYLCGWGQVLTAVVPAGVRKRAGTREITCYRAADGASSALEKKRLSTKQRVILETLCQSSAPLPVDELSKAAGCGVSPIRTLRDKGLIVPVRVRTSAVEQDTTALAEQQPDLTLNPDQLRAVEQIQGLLRASKHACVLLHGVTGSGKTEVYIQAIREVVSYGRQAIVLVPEISLTPQTIRRFRRRFPSVAVLHSHLSDAERHAQWERIAKGKVDVVVGARSAVFAPTPHLGLIVIDEEHETSFKQNSTPRYHTREVARERARREGVPLILGSATPTLESLVRATRGGDLLLSLPERVERRPMPPVVIVDTRNDPYITKGQSIGRALQAAMKRALDDGGQVILFLNLRGYSTVLWCYSCGAGVMCPECDVTLTWHRDRNRVVCHSCDFTAPRPSGCLHCGAPALKYLGAGTQRLEQEVQAKFPEHRIARMDSDAMRKRGSHDTVLNAFRNGAIDILLGTQMIAKGLDFPNVTLVGVVDADTVLHQPDLRAAERTFQLIAQVAGRTGRGPKGGRVLVQTMCPDEPVIRSAAKHDYLGFAQRELDQRRELLLPPFWSLARVILRGRAEDVVQADARRLAGLVRDAAESSGASVRIAGPAPAPLLKLKGLYRHHFRLQAEQPEEIQELWRRVSDQMRPSQGVELVIDVDPLDLR
mgnify:CR=1 FL=1